MAVRSALLLSRMVNWHKKPVDKPVHIRWPKNMLPYLEKNFRLHPKEMALLQCVQHPGSLRGLPISFVRLYDRMAAQQQRIVIRNYGDLDSNPDLIQFEGHIFQDGKVYLRKKQVHVN